MAGKFDSLNEEQGITVEASVAVYSRTQVQLPPAIPLAKGFLTPKTDAFPLRVKPPATTLKVADW